MGFQLALWAAAAIGMLAFLLVGDGLRARYTDVRAAVVFFNVAGAIVILLLDMPGAHSSHCGMSAGAWSLQLTGAWWLPNASCARLLEPSVERAWLLPLWGGGSLALAYLLEGATHEREGVPWWTIHVLCQLSIAAPIALTFRRGFRRAALVLPLVAALLPFGPWSFWHACTRIRIGDPLEEVVEKLGGYWLIPDPWGNSGSRVPVSELEPRALSMHAGLSFAATGDNDACTCGVVLQAGRVASFEMSPD